MYFKILENQFVMKKMKVFGNTGSTILQYMEDYIILTLNCLTFSWPKILIDGPYGAPSQDYKKFEVVLLVGLGIGATPVISIIKDIINNLKDNEDEEEGRGSNGNHNVVTPPPISPARKREMFITKRAYFHWSTKEQGTFDWFKNVLDEVAEADVNNVIELHNYCSSIYQEGDARSALITMLQSLYHAKNGRDIVSGTRVMSESARPKWRSIYKRIAVRHPDTRVGEFLRQSYLIYCFLCIYNLIAKKLKVWCIWQECCFAD